VNGTRTDDDDKLVRASPVDSSGSLATTSRDGILSFLGNLQRIEREQSGSSQTDSIPPLRSEHVWMGGETNGNLRLEEIRGDERLEAKDTSVL
jgi:hypothetical protein